VSVKSTILAMLLAGLPAGALACRTSPVHQVLFDRVPTGLPGDTQVLEVTFAALPAGKSSIPRDVTYETVRVRRVLRGAPPGPALVVRIPGVCHVYDSRVSGLLVGRLVVDARAPGGRAFMVYEVAEPSRTGPSPVVDEHHRPVGFVDTAREELRVARRPSPADLRRLYSRSAQLQRRLGIAELACSVRPDGRLHGCVVLGETPPNAGLGRASLQAASLYRFKLPLRRRLVDPTVKISLSFGDPPDLRAFP